MSENRENRENRETAKPRNHETTKPRKGENLPGMKYMEPMTRYICEGS